MHVFIKSYSYLFFVVFINQHKEDLVSSLKVRPRKKEKTLKKEIQLQEIEGADAHGPGPGTRKMNDGP